MEHLKYNYPVEEITENCLDHCELKDIQIGSVACKQECDCIVDYSDEDQWIKCSFLTILSIFNKPDPEILKEFFIWCARTAKIDIIDAENAIEVDGYSSENFTPIWSLDKLVKQFILERKDK